MSSRSIGVIGAGIIGTVISCFLKRDVHDVTHFDARRRAWQQLRRVVRLVRRHDLNLMCWRIIGTTLRSTIPALTAASL